MKEVKRCALCAGARDDTFEALRYYMLGSGKAAACHERCEALWIFDETGLCMVYRLGCGHYCVHHVGHRCCRCREDTA